MKVIDKAAKFFEKLTDVYNAGGEETRQQMYLLIMWVDWMESEMDEGSTVMECAEEMLHRTLTTALQHKLLPATMITGWLNFSNKTIMKVWEHGTDFAIWNLATMTEQTKKGDALEAVLKRQEQVWHDQGNCPSGCRPCEAGKKAPRKTEVTTVVFTIGADGVAQVSR